MRIHRLLAGLLFCATLSSAAWKTLRDAPDGWSGRYPLLATDSVSRDLPARTLAIPAGADPVLNATMTGPGNLRLPVTVRKRSVRWNGANLLQVHLRLSDAQRALGNLPQWTVELEATWKRSPSGTALLPIVANTIANAKGAAYFGAPRVSARRSATPLARLPSGPALTVEIGDLSKRDDKAVSRTTDHGIFRLTGKDLKNLFGSLAGSSLRNISVYRSARDTLPSVAGAMAAPVLQPVRIERISANLDGTIQDGDEIRFYVEGTSVWVRDTESSCGSGWKLSVSPYALTRRYLVALQPDGEHQPLSPSLLQAPPSAATSPSYPVQTWALEKHQLLTNGEVGHEDIPDNASGTNWFWLKTTPTTNLVTGMSPDGLVSDSGCIELDFAAKRSTSTVFLTGLGVNGAPATLLSTAGLRSFWSSSALKAGNTILTLEGSNDENFLGFSLHARQSPLLVSGQAEFPAPKLGSLSVPLRVPSSVNDSLIGYAVVEGQLVRRVSLTRHAAGDSNGWTGWLLSDSAADLSTRYRVGTVSSMLSSSSSVASLKTWSPPSANLAMVDFGAETGDSMLVIAPESFSGVAQEYADYRTNQSPKRKLKTRFVRMEDIYLLYSGGAADPTALRDFLRWSRSSQGTSHVLFLGSAYYDMRDLLKTGNPTMVPTWESGNFASDNYFAYLDSAEWTEPNARTLDVHIGRIPARSSSKVAAWFEKLKIYESLQPGQDPSWRNTALLIADDFYINDGIPFTADGAGNHARQSEELYQNLLNARPWLGFSKVFLDKYDYDANNNKPMARLDIVSRVNQGVMLFNYFGHGAGNQLSHETVFDLGTISALSNANSPFLFYAGACAVGRFDGADEPLGVSLLNASKRGAVATISATRATYSAPNGVLNLAFFQAAFDTTPGFRSIGEILTAARNGVISSEGTWVSTFGDMTNQDAYVLLGDPAMPLANVGLRVGIDSFPDTLQALYAFKKAGTTSSNNPTSLAFRIQGSALIDTLQGDGIHPIAELPTAVTLEPKQILSLTSSVNAGQLTVEGMTPAKLEFGKFGSISAFAIDQITGACGGYYQGDILQYGTDTSGSDDVLGPSITFAPCDSSYSAGEPFVGIAKVPLPFCLQVNLTDKTGISSATGPDEGTFVSLPGVWETFHPTLKSGTSFRQSSFQLNIDSTKFAAGTSHQLSVLSHDQMGNYSRGSLQIQVQTEEAVGLYDVFNRPNPVKGGTSTTFYFKVTASPDTNNAIPSSLQASVRIHTLSGKLIRVLRTDLTQEQALRPKATWDLKDAFGNEVANGLYPYTVLLRVPGSTSGAWEQYEKRGIVAISR